MLFTGCDGDMAGGSRWARSVTGSADHSSSMMAWFWPKPCSGGLEAQQKAHPSSGFHGSQTRWLAMQPFMCRPTKPWGIVFSRFFPATASSETVQRSDGWRVHRGGRVLVAYVRSNVAASRQKCRYRATCTVEACFALHFADATEVWRSRGF